MELRRSDLFQIKEQLMKELERAISKRDTISSKGRATIINSSKPGFKMTEKQLEKKVDELKRSIADTENECTATDERVAKMDTQRATLANNLQDIAARCNEIRTQEQQMCEDVEDLLLEKTAKLLRTARLQTAVRALEEAVAGRYKFSVADQSTVLAEAETAQSKQSRIAAVVQQLAENSVDVSSQLQRVLLHIQAVEIF